ncbi:MAG: radical SAM protein [Clostridia bacterium]|nr:radical SAM protein [Clostridia bacterium]
MKPIYVPKGKAKEYGDYALNIYTGCPHRCFYCFAPNVLRREKEQFHAVVKPRENIVEETRKQIEKEGITGKLIHLCFTCDPYPLGHDTTVTREIISLLKSTGNNVQILTKGNGRRDFDLLGPEDWYGITLDGGLTFKHEVASFPVTRAETLREAHARGIKTWVSFEPVLNAETVLKNIKYVAEFVDKVKIGKLNYHPSDIDWAEFGRKAESLCQKLGLDYYIKESLRAEMEAAK